jgi:SAM-dependent methyltransferase
MPLEQEGSFLVCPGGHDYPVVDGVPILLLADKEQTIGIAKASLASARLVAEGGVSEDPWFTSTLGISEAEKAGILELAKSPGASIDPVVQFMIGATNGLLYKDLIGKCKSYTIPELRLQPGNGGRLLDIGCNWGRWSVAAARLGYRPVGIDPSLGAVFAARRVSRQLGLTADFVVGDARFLPFPDGFFDAVFSYSVIQHFSKDDARRSLAEAGRVLKPGGHSLVQMPNRFGLRCLFHQAGRGFRSAAGFEVRYWSLPELRRAFTSTIGPARFSVDCFFGLGLQAADLNLMSRRNRSVVQLSEFLRLLSKRLPVLSYLADSIYVESIRSTSGAQSNRNVQ